MAKSTYDFPTDISFEETASDVLLSGLRKMIGNIEATRSGLKKSVASPEEIEALHDMRVGSRRLRAGLEVFGKVFSKRDYRSLNRDLGAVTDALGAVRDLDVQLDSLRALTSTLSPNEAYGIGRLIERQSGKRDRERKTLLAELDRLEKSGFGRRVKRLIKTSVAAFGTKKPQGASRDKEEEPS